MSDSTSGADILGITADIVSAYVSSNPVSVSDLPNLIQEVHRTVAQLVEGGTSAPAPVVPKEPAVPVRKSITPDYIVCLEDGRKLKMLKRHLQTTYGLTPEEYRAKWGLPKNYPMVAPIYAARRSAIAKEVGLGHGRTKAAAK